MKTDRLGSVRVSGTSERFSYLPYGEERTPTTDGREKFGTYYREMGALDYADQRYYNPNTGSFWSPDPAGLNAVDPSNPSTWNMYAYVHGDPVNYNDEDGTGECAVGQPLPCTTTVTGSAPGAPNPNPSPGYGTGSVNGSEIPKDDSGDGGTSQQGGGGLGGGFAGALNSFQRAANKISKMKKFKTPCNNDFAALGTTAAAVQAGAGDVDIENGNGSAVLEASLYANTGAAASAAAQYGNLTVGQFFMQNPRTVAQAQLNGNTVYINPGLINTNSYFQNLGTMLHELLHNVTGLTDDQIQSDLGLSTAQVSNNITQKLIKDCF